VLLLLRQFAVITESSRRRWRVSYAYPCTRRGLVEEGKPGNALLQPAKPGCTVVLWLEPQEIGTDVYVAYEGSGDLATRDIEVVLDRIATQLFAEAKLRYLMLPEGR
jgi:hypothetical protein